MAYTDIDDPSAYFTTTLWTGDGTSSGRSITNSANAGNFQPDWLWIKPRTGTNATHHQLYDSSRGVSKSLRSSADAAEIASSAYGHVSAYDTNGFTSIAGSNNNENLNENSSTFVSWQWKANGGTTSSNTDGSITSTVQANTTAGFSIVTYTGTGSNATIGHGLGAVPDMVIVKNRTASDNWGVQLANALGNTNALRLNNTDAYGGSDGALWWNDTSPTSTTISIGTRNEVNQNTKNYVMYCFKNIQGYSKIGKYIGNGSNEGTFVYTGFKPAWVMVKGTSSGREWFMFDGTRDTFNPFNKYVKAESNDAEASSNFGDFCSNGFKVRSDGASYNASGETFIYMAFAEHPFVSSEGVPTTAR